MGQEKDVWPPPPALAPPEVQRRETGFRVWVTRLLSAVPGPWQRAYDRWPILGFFLSLLPYMAAGFVLSRPPYPYDLNYGPSVLLHHEALFLVPAVVALDWAIGDVIRGVRVMNVFSFMLSVIGVLMSLKILWFFLVSDDAAGFYFP